MRIFKFKTTPGLGDVDYSLLLPIIIVLGFILMILIAKDQEDLIKSEFDYPFGTPKPTANWLRPYGPPPQK